MTPRAGGRRVGCDPTDARARLRDAEAFLDAAEVSDHSDVVATNAIHAAIAAADAICCVGLRERSSDGNHTAAVALLRQVDPALANALARCLSRKSQAAYETRSVGKRDAQSCLRQAHTLLDAARSRIQAL